MSPLARVSDEHVGDVAIAVVEGEIDASNAPAIGERLRDALTNRSLALIVDLERTTYLDSAGINVLFELGAELRQRRQQLHLVVPSSSPLMRLVAICGLDVTNPTHASRASALEQAADAA